MSASAIPPDIFAKVTRAWAIQDYAEGERLLAEGCKSYPDHFHLRTCHAAALGYCARITEAKTAFDALIADAPPEKKVHMHGLLGVEWCRIGRHDLAIPLLEAAAKSPVPVPPIYEALADALEHLGRRDEAAAVVEEGLRHHPHHPGIVLVQVRLQRAAGQLELAETALRRLLASSIASPEAKTRAGHELGHVLDAQGRFAEAFAAFSQAKREREAILAPFIPLWQAKQAQLTQADHLPTREDFQRFDRDTGISPDERRSVAFLVGCPRSGTTLLERVLDAHPGILSASEEPVFGQHWNTLVRSLSKEAHAHTGAMSSLSQALAHVSQAQLAAFRQDYWRGMEDALEEPIGHRLLLDKNPSQLTLVPTLARIFPEARILMAVRDPRAVAWSCFTQYLPDNPESAGFNTLPTVAAHVGAQLRFWLHLRDHFPGAWHESRYEDTVSDLRASAEKTLAFLGLEWREEMARFHERERPVRSPTYAQAAKPIYTRAVDNWHNYEPFLGGAFEALAPVAKKLGY